MRLIRFTALVAAAFTVSVGAPHLGAQLQPSAPLQDAYFAWDEGRYVDALEAYLEVLGGDGGEALAGEVALLTGELHPVRFLDGDGQDLRVSADGEHLLWHRPRGDGSTERVSVVAPAPGEEDQDGESVVLPGSISAVSGEGEVSWVEGRELRVRSLATGEERVRLPLDGLVPAALVFAPDRGDLYLTAVREEDPRRLRILRLPEGSGELELLDLGPGHASNPIPARGGRFLVFTRPERPTLPAGIPDPPDPTPEPGIGLLDLRTGAVVRLDGRLPSVSADGSYLSFADTRPTADGTASLHRILGLRLEPGALSETGAVEPRILVEEPYSLDRPAVAPDGDRVAFQARPQTTWEIFLVATDGTDAVEQLTREVQHDQFPAWVSSTRLIAMKGEFRHRRSYIYDTETGEGYRLFFSDALRTIAPEYDWAPHPGGEGILLSAERDGDTIAPERPVYWVDLTRTIGREELAERLERQLLEERDLLARGEAAFEPVAEEAWAVTRAVSVGRISRYAADLYAFGPKFVTEAGNAPATAYLAETLESWGYEVELQWWEPLGVRAANVVATLPGTTDPGIVYVISSHFDSVPLSPGADDNSSGTTALLEAARVLREHPRRATVKFAFLNAEEAGLLGARELVRRAVEDGTRIAGVLNNDMIGWARNHRLDNTIRHGNAGIRDLQHAAAHYFSGLITYDAFYTRGTDAAVFYDQYGDITGGIGSYPVLGSPHYHQPTDRLHTVDQRQVAEVSRTTVASMMLLADSPAPVSGLRVVAEDGGRTVIGWSVSPESGVSGYRVQIAAGDGRWTEAGVVEEPRLTLPDGGDIARVRARAVRDNGTEGWDWALLEL